MGFPGPLLLAAWTLFATSASGTLVAFGVFLPHDTGFWSRFEPAPVLRVAVSLAAGLAVSSGVLFWHYRRRKSYSTFEEIFFIFVLFASSINFSWMAPLLFFP